MDRYEKHKHKTFRQAADRYLEEFEGKAYKRQWYALRSVLPYIAD